ncbi:MAG: ABC transporter permease [Alphaproteobacteria bacterium]|nr:ABC transporter permease [Alphaproteobacteria bacterium]
MWRLAIRNQVRIVSTLIRREMVSHFGESRLGYLWALLGPALQLGGVIVVFDLILHRKVPLGRSTALFVLTGFVSYYLFMKTATYVSGAITGNRGLLTLPPIKPYDLICARAILEAATYSFVAFIMFVVLFLVGVSDAIPSDILTVIQACALAVCLGVGIGMINIVLNGYLHWWMMFFYLWSFPTWMLSGVWFLPEQVPEGLREWMLYNPVMHIVMLFRMGFYPDYKGVYLDVPYAVACAAGAVAIGMAAMKVGYRRVLSPL